MNWKLATVALALAVALSIGVRASAQQETSLRCDEVPQMRAAILEAIEHTKKHGLEAALEDDVYKNTVWYAAFKMYGDLLRTLENWEKQNCQAV